MSEFPKANMVSASTFQYSVFADLMLGVGLACYNIAKACGVAAPEVYHHNAGVDARESIESVLAMLLVWSGTRIAGCHHNAGVDARESIESVLLLDRFRAKIELHNGNVAQAITLLKQRATERDPKKPHSAIPEACWCQDHVWSLSLIKCRPSAGFTRWYVSLPPPGTI